MTAPERLVIVGSGPAAWTAAVYAARANLSPLVFEGALTEENRVGGVLPLGQLNLGGEVENFPGFPGGVLGPELVLRMREQAERYGARVVTEDVARLRVARGGVTPRPIQLDVSDGSGARAHAVVLATGGRARHLDVPTLPQFVNRGVSSCAVSDGPLPRFRARPVIVVGGGDHAAQVALWMTKFSDPVYLVHRRDRLRATAPLASAVLGHPKIRVRWNAVVAKLTGTEHDGLRSVRLRDVRSGAETEVDAFGLFAPIGQEPNTALVAGLIELDAAGYVRLPNPPGTMTSVPGVFAAGEVADPVYRQAVTAAASGCRAAIDAERWLAGQGVR